MPRRYADYRPTDGFTTLNTVSTIGSFILGASTLFFLYNVWKSYRYGRLVGVDDPWGHGNSLEWATSSPPPLRNFERLPRIRSERPAFDAKFPHLAAGGQSLAGPPEGGAKPLTSESDHGASYQEDTGSGADRRPTGDE
jgi:cytochrome c oxidase subunit 1